MAAKSAVGANLTLAVVKVPALISSEKPAVTILLKLAPVEALAGNTPITVGLVLSAPEPVRNDKKNGLDMAVLVLLVVVEKTLTM